MKFTETEIEGCYVLDFFHIQDDRGSFVKPMHRGELEAQGLDGQFDESFYSVNSKGVVRGMHSNYHLKITAKLCTARAAVCWMLFSI